MDDLRARLRAIENDLDRGTYQPGPWGALMRNIRQQPPDQRAALADDISRVSNKLHRRNRRFTMPFPLAFLLELAATVLGVLLLRRGLQNTSPLYVGAAANILSMTMQPLVKIMTGLSLGVRYAYAYAQGVEPHFKMRYGSYLAAPLWKRVVVQASGMLGTPLALWGIAKLSALEMPRTSKVCRVLFWFLGAWQVILFVLGLVGVKRLGKLELVRGTSGGAAGGELRDAFVE
jgi:hypothetical protein